MKIEIILVLATSVCCHCQSSTPTPPQPTTASGDVIKEHLLQRAAELDTKLKADIKTLYDNHREHLSQGLHFEEEKLDQLINELKETNPGPEALRLLEEEINLVEQRIANELRFLENEANGVTKTEDQLLADAITLHGYVSEEIKKLEATTGEERERALIVARSLRQEQVLLERVAQSLIESQNARELARIEVQLRTVEVRLNEALRRLNFKPQQVTNTPAPQQSSTAPPAPVSTGSY